MTMACSPDTPVHGTTHTTTRTARRAYVEDQVTSRGVGTSSEHVRDLIRKDQDQDQDQQRLRALLLDGAASEAGATAGAAWLASLRERATGNAEK